MERIEQVRELKNVSDRPVTAKLQGGASVTLPPGSTVRDVPVANLPEIRTSVTAKQDLAEVRGQGTKQYLRS